MLTPRSGACRDAAPSDLQYLTDENIAEIGVEHQVVSVADSCHRLIVAVCAGTAMTHIEKMRMQAALQALSGALPAPACVGPC